MLETLGATLALVVVYAIAASCGVWPVIGG
jgi:hypothetical protein